MSLSVPLFSHCARGLLRRASTNAGLGVGAHLGVAKPVKVLKFGGSSVGSGEAMRRVASIISAESSTHSPVAVLSAMYGVTNCLVRATEAAASGNLEEVSSMRARIRRLHEIAANDMIASPARRDKCMLFIDERLKAHFDRPCDEIMSLKECTAVHKDEVWSLGERFTNMLVSEYMTEQEEHTNAAELVESSRVVVTDDVSGGASPLLEPTKERVMDIIAPLLRVGTVPLVTGYFGSSGEKITTLGRGGSDLSASVLAYALDASAVELYKVECSTTKDGWLREWEPGWEGIVHDADPSATIESLSYEEAAELAHFGKKVLHPQTVFPAIQKGIPIAIKNTLAPHRPGTLIRMDSSPVPGGLIDIEELTSMSYDDASEMSDATDVPEGIVSTVTKAPMHRYASQHSAQLPVPEWAKRPTDAALIAVVGRHACRYEEVAAATLDVLRSAGIEVEVPQRVNGSEHNFTVIVPEAKAKQAVHALHQNLVLPSQPSV